MVRAPRLLSEVPRVPTFVDYHTMATMIILLPVGRHWRAISLEMKLGIGIFNLIDHQLFIQNG